MKIVMLASGASIHTVRWVNGLTQAGVDVTLVTQQEPKEPIRGVRTLILPHRGALGYVRNALPLKRFLLEERADLLNAHYASGYGTTARLARFRPTLLSVWGSDVYDFPTRSPVHRWWLRGNLQAAERVASTSHVMAAQTVRIAPSLGDIAITPFGIDLDHFSPGGDRSRSTEDPIVIGTVKSLSEKYGIDTLINAFAILRQRLAAEDKALADRLRLQIVGDGPQRPALKALAEGFGLADVTEFLPAVPHVQVPGVLRHLDVYVALSRYDSESFGVAVIEAGACGLPVVVSDVGGLPEVVLNGITGLVVPREAPMEAAEALRKLVTDANLQRVLGEAARKHVAEHYTWRENVDQMIAVYEETIAISRGQASKRAAV